ncbi:hypothetical protein ACWD4T_38715 [Streptomyces umbrinus]
MVRLKSKPVGWDKVFTNAKDKGSHFTSVFYGVFSCIVNTRQLPANASDFKRTELLKPEYNNKLILTYPNDASGAASGDYLASIAVGGDACPDGTQVFLGYCRGEPRSRQ